MLFILDGILLFSLETFPLTMEPRRYATLVLLETRSVRQLFLLEPSNNVLPAGGGQCASHPLLPVRQRHREKKWVRQSASQ